MKEVIRKNTVSTSNAATRMVYIPVKIARDMGLTAEEPAVWMIYDYETKEITIKKAEE